MMEKLKAVLTTLRNHKKKSIFAAVCISYAGYYLQNKQRKNKLFTEYCHLAKKFGEELISPVQKNRRITVLINDRAKNGKARYDFEKYALPMLHLAGLDVSIVRPKSEDEAIEICSVIDKNDTDGLYVVGGDGTISTIINGMLKNVDEKTSAKYQLRNFPALAVFPAGLENRIAKNLYPPSDEGKWDSELRWYCENALAIIQGIVKYANVLKVDMDEENFHIGQYINIGNAFSTVETQKYRFWYMGTLKRRFAYLWNWIWVTPNSQDFVLTYQIPCQGCSKCWKNDMVENTASSRSWWSRLLHSKPKADAGEAFEDRSKITNAACGITISEQLQTTDFRIENALPPHERGFLIHCGAESLSKWDFLKESMKKINQANDSESSSRRFQVGAASLIPVDSENEFNAVVDGDLKTIKGELKVSIVPDALKIFSPL